MNNLSWLIYLADITCSVGGLFTFLAVISGGGVVVAVISANLPDGDFFFATAASARRFCQLAATAGIAFGLLAAIIPGPQTVMMIAASEIGQRVVNSNAAAMHLAHKCMC